MFGTPGDGPSTNVAIRPHLYDSSTVHDQPRVSVVIVTWNTREILDETLAALHRRTMESFETIVVDNGSTDGTEEHVRSAWPQVRVIRSETNLGFAGGNNLAFPACRGRYILLLNSDTLVADSTISGLADFLDRHPATGCVGARHLNPDLTLQRSVGHFPSLIEDLVAYTELDRLGPIQPFLRRRFAYWGDYDQVREVDWVNGSCLMVRREVVDEVGGLDDGYFMYAEEIDWCFRIRAAGWQVHFTPHAELIHVGGVSANAIADRRAWLKITSQYRFYRKFRPAWKRGLWRLMVAFVALARLAMTPALGLALASSLPPGRRRLIWEIVAREPIVGDARTAARTWLWIFRFATVDPGMRWSIDRAPMRIVNRPRGSPPCA
jgi:GT2 family glycosyltransferase